MQPKGSLKIYEESKQITPRSNEQQQQQEATIKKEYYDNDFTFFYALNMPWVSTKTCAAPKASYDDG